MAPNKLRTVKGAFHVHSSYSGDGELELAEIKKLFQRDGFNFVAICEHQHDVSKAGFHSLTEDCKRLSEEDFLLVPGIEFNCHRNHILGIGIHAYDDSLKDDAIVDWIKAKDGFAVWAHPRKNGYCLPTNMIAQLDGMEIWNAKGDGKHAPQAEVVHYYNLQKGAHRGLRALCSLDFHFRKQSRKLPVYCQVTSLTVDCIVNSLRDGLYSTRKGSLVVGSDGKVTVSGWPGPYVMNEIEMQLLAACKCANAILKRHNFVLPGFVRDLGRWLLS